MDRRTPSIRCAQYLRMSREHQKYSPANQSAAIAKYAQENGFEVVRTYQDDGRSGLTLQGRKGLQRLLGDVLSGRSDFTHVLVLDVSRWGRFQDPDQGAHYEFLCREAGVAIHYCEEVFSNDGTSAASIMKTLKRLMAAEFSRELGQKVWAGQAAGVRRGQKQGGKCPFGLRRLLIDDAGHPIRLLQRGQRKSVQTDRVVLIHGPDSEVAAVRDVFRLFTRDKLPFKAIAARLNERGMLCEDGGPLTTLRVGAILRNEIYTGVYTWNRTSQRLRTGVRPNPAAMWFANAMFPAIISRRTFNAAQARLADVGRRTYTDEELLNVLRAVHDKYGGVTLPLLRRLKRPSATLFYRRWACLADALEAAGCGRPSRQRRRVDPEAKYPAAQLADRPKALLEREGYLSTKLIDADPTLPTSTKVRDRFGSLCAAYNAAGWDVSLLTVRQLATARRWRRNTSVSLLASAIQQETSHVDGTPSQG